MACSIGGLLIRLPLDYLESWTCDLRVQLQPVTSPSGYVQLIAVDSQSIEALKHDPNASDHIQLIDQLKKTNMYALVYLKDPSQLSGTKEEFRHLALKFADLKNFIVSRDQVPIKGEEDQLKLKPPFHLLRALAGPQTADINSFAKDKVTRRLIVSYRGVPTLHALLAQPQNDLNFDAQVKPLSFSGLFDFFDTQQAFIHYHPSGTYKPYSFIQILKGQFHPDDFKHKIVLLGYDTLNNATDYILTPYSRSVVAMSALEMHSNIIDTLIQNSAPKKASPWINVFLTLIISVLTVHVVLSLNPLKGLIILGSTFFVFVLSSILTFIFFNIWVDMTHPSLAIFICYYFFIPYRLIVEYRTSWEYLQRNKLLTQVEELKSNFLRMMSHDLKTPLARIQGMTEIVCADPHQLSQKQIEAITRIRQSSCELTEFISSILNVGRIELKEIKLQLKSKDINKLLNQIIEQHMDLAESRNIQLITEFEPLFSLRVDEDLLRQVFTNLLENAIKYSKDKSKILISTEEVEGQIVVQVADQGMGISPDELSQIFTKFYRSDSVKNSSIKGTGLGLYLAKYFVELHGGTLTVESEIERGSTFTVTLPVQSIKSAMNAGGKIKH